VTGVQTCALPISHWHTVNDNMNIIDRETLKATGQTALEVIYKY
jgi:hypothetical protein